MSVYTILPSRKQAICACHGLWDIPASAIFVDSITQVHESYIADTVTIPAVRS